MTIDRETLDLLIRAGIEKVKNMTEEELSAMLKEQAESWVRGEMGMRESARMLPPEVEPPAHFAGYQKRVNNWMQQCFGPEIAADRQERTYRFLEESIELAQANGCPREDARRLVEYVYSRPPGYISQEVGGVMVCLAALCTAAGVNLTHASEVELDRVWKNIDKIRAKHAAKDIRSPLPGYAPPSKHYLGPDVDD